MGTKNRRQIPSLGFRSPHRIQERQHGNSDTGSGEEDEDDEAQEDSDTGSDEDNEAQEFRSNSINTCNQEAAEAEAPHLHVPQKRFKEEEEQTPELDIDVDEACDMLKKLIDQIILLQDEIYNSHVGVLCGYTTYTKSWAIADVPPPRNLGVDWESHYVVWKDCQSGRVFMAASFALTPGTNTNLLALDLCSDIGFEVWELKPKFGPGPGPVSYRWQLISSTPASLPGAKYEATPPGGPDGTFRYLMEDTDTGDTDNPFGTKRSVYRRIVVCMTVVDHPIGKFFPRGSYSCPLLYDVDGSKWSRLPTPPKSPSSCWSGYLPLVKLIFP